MSAHHDVAASRSDFSDEGLDRIAGVDRISCSSGSIFRAELRSDTLGGVDRPLLVAVQNARGRDAELAKARTQPIGLFTTFRADVALRILLGGQRIGMMNE